jgi:hypothetical protein
VGTKDVKIVIGAMDGQAIHLDLRIDLFPTAEQFPCALADVGAGFVPELGC